MLTLYGCAGTRTFRPLWLLEEVELDYSYKKIDVFKGDGRDSAYRKLNPLGKVPTLDDDGLILYEAAAICMYLTDHYAPHLAPDYQSPERGAYYQWMFYVPATLEPPLMTIFLHGFLLPEQRRIASLVEQAKKQFKPIARVLERQLAERVYLLGDQFSTADIMLASTLQWFPELLEPFPALQAYCDRLIERAAYQRARAKESGD